MSKTFCGKIPDYKATNSAIANFNSDFSNKTHLSVTVEHFGKKMKLKQNSTICESECVGFLFISLDVGYPSHLR